ncbi:hypothetical protein GA0070609_3690 [Micromonospora echinaurantiaca]|uniref:Flavin reductase n=1 Tax=Micromonospora echinaurantiaca TaxID=47857 RepID=A0A1C5IS46_9ACTN|nr:hypothetical protein GA0070609_3690 [Micromonospora echinaurantiaca]
MGGRAESVPRTGRRHVAARPAWRCRACAAPWPCQPAKLALRVEYAHDPVGLSVYLCVLLHEAAADWLRLRPRPPDPAELFARFVGWTRPVGAAAERGRLDRLLDRVTAAGPGTRRRAGPGRPGRVPDRRRPAG